MLVDEEWLLITTLISALRICQTHDHELHRAATQLNFAKHDALITGYRTVVAELAALAALYNQCVFFRPLPGICPLRPRSTVPALTLTLTMSFSARFAALVLAFVAAVQAGPLVNIKSTHGAQIVPNGYIVSLKPGAALSAHRNILRNFKREDSDVAYEWPSLNAFAGTFSDDALQALRESEDVVAIECDTIGGVDAVVVQTDAIWNLQRISQAAKLTSNSTSARNYNYTYDDSAGEGVDIYVIDTGESRDRSVACTL